VNFTHSSRVDSLPSPPSGPTVTYVGEAPLLVELKPAGKRLARTRADVDELIVKAATESHSLRVPSKASGVSHERVRQLLQRRSNDG
jgi:hypothetical protein